MSNMKREITFVAEQLQSFGLSGSIILLPAMVPDEEAEAIYAARFDIKKHSQTWWDYYSKSRGKLVCKVQKKAKRITGNCHGYKHNRAGACGHIAHYCRANGLPVPGPYLLARRLEPSQIIHAKGMKAVSRDNYARQNGQQEVRKKLFELCAPLRDPRAPKTSKTGQPRIPYRALVYMFLVQVAEGLTDVNAAAQMGNDQWYSKLTGDRSRYKKNGGPSDQTISEIIWLSALSKDVKKMVSTTARCGRKMDSLAAMDATGYGTTNLGNWFVKKYAVKKKAAKEQAESPEETEDRAVYARIRGTKGFIKVHTVEGVESGLIYAINVTLDVGDGTADTRQFQTLVKKSLEVNPSLRMMLADKGYWDDDHFGFMQALSVMLMVMMKVNISPANAASGREMIAFLEYLRLNHPAVYRTFYRYRQSIEASFSVQKRVTRHIRRRVRKAERRRIVERQALIERNVNLNWLKFGSPKPKNWEKSLAFAAGLLAQEIVGQAQANEAHAMALAANLREIIKWERQIDETMNFAADTAFTPLRRVFVPWAA